MMTSAVVSALSDELMGQAYGSAATLFVDDIIFSTLGFSPSPNDA